MAEGRAWRSVSIEGADGHGVARLLLNRPSKGNALDAAAFSELPAALEALDADSGVRAILFAGAGAHFCTGIDLSSLAGISSQSMSGNASDNTRGRERLRRQILHMQAAISALEACRKPVIAVIHGGCIGGGIDVISACDLRYCTTDAFFSVKEVDVGLTADLGSLQRLPRIIGDATTMELALTARTFNGVEAKALGLVHDVLPSRPQLEEHALGVARQIAAKSPLAVAGTKAVLVKCRDLSSVAQGLDYVATWNAAMLSSDDVTEAIEAIKEKRQPAFAKL